VSCFHPVTGYRSKMGRSPSGGWPIVFNINEGYIDKSVVIPCGKCIGCRLDKTASWAMRIMCEAEMHTQNCYITLTYRDEDLNAIQSLSKEEISAFWKRLRFELSEKNRPGKGRTIRYFSAGEYGDKYSRPHYHAALFGFDFSEDKLAWKQGEKDILFRSETLEKVWGKGICTIQELNHQSALYIAKYVVKKLSGLSSEKYEGKLPEFALMSKRPGLAKKWLEKYVQDVKAVDGVVISAGKIARPGRYFDDIMSKLDPKRMEKVKRERRKKINPENDSWRRLEAKEKLKFHQMKWFRSS